MSSAGDKYKNKTDKESTYLPKSAESDTKAKIDNHKLSKVEQTIETLGPNPKNVVRTKNRKITKNDMTGLAPRTDKNMYTATEPNGELKNVSKIDTATERNKIYASLKSSLPQIYLCTIYIYVYVCGIGICTYKVL